MDRAASLLHSVFGFPDFRPGQAEGPFITARKAFGILQGSPQYVALGLGIGIGLGWPALNGVFAVGANEGDINAVQRGAGHQA